MMPVRSVAQMARMAKRLKASAVSEVGALPLRPEVDDDGEHGAGVQHDQQQRHFRRGGVEAEQFFGNDNVGGTGDGQEFGEALDDGQDEDFPEAAYVDSKRSFFGHRLPSSSQNMDNKGV